MRKIPLALTALLGVVFLLGIDRWHVDSWQKDMNEELTATAIRYHHRLENAIAIRLNAVESLVALFVMHPDTGKEEFEKFSNHIIQTNHTIKTLQFADSNTVITYTFPTKGNDIVIQEPLTLLNDPKRSPFVKKAISQKSASVQGPFNLRQGGSGIVVRSPIFVENTFSGLAIGIYDIETLIEDAFAGINLKRLSFSLKDSKDRIFYGQNNDFDVVNEKSVQVGDSAWTMTVGWNKGPGSAPLTYRAVIWTFGLGFLVSLLFLARKSFSQYIHLEQKVEERTRRLNQSNKALSAEIAERKNTEQKLKESEERYNYAMSASQDGLYDWNLITNEIYYSPSWKQMLGYADDELPNDFSVWENLTAPDHVERAWKVQEELIAKKRDRFEMEFKMKHKDGHWVDILSRAKAVFNEKNEAVRIVGTHVDISERKRYEADLKLKDAAIENSLNGFDIVNEQGQLIYANRTFVKMYGYSSSSELIGLSPSDLCEDPALPQKIISTLKKSGEYEFEHRAKKKDGSIFDVLMYARLAYDENGKEIYPTTSIDITEKRIAQNEKEKLQEQLRQAQKMEAIGTLAGGIAHDFNNLLSIIIGFTEIVKDDSHPSSANQENLDQVMNASLRAKDLVKQILAFSRQSDSEKILMQPANLVKESIKLIRPSIPTTIEIEYDIAQDTDPIIADPSQLNQVIMNLCTNAFHAMEKTGGQLKISLKSKFLDRNELKNFDAQKPGNYVQLSVSDTGYGIDSEIIGRVFDPFFTTKGIGKGTGMGLSIVHGIANDHGGFVTIQSKSGKGTTINVFIPASGAEIKRDETPSEVIPRGKENILLVDDEEILAQMNKVMLESLGYSVTALNSSFEAFQAFKKDPERFDLIITDQTMPGMTGVDLSKRVLHIKHDFPIILCTGYSSTISEKEAKSIGIKEFALKPLGRKTLAEIIRNVLDAPRATKS